MKTKIPKGMGLREWLGQRRNGGSKAFDLPRAHFDGDTYEVEYDFDRLTTQLARTFNVITDGRWRTLGEISELVEAPEASVSARLRDLRKQKFGGYTVDRRPRGDRERGLYEYRLA